MKYQSELIKEIVDKEGHNIPHLHYQSECVNHWIEEIRGAYPKLIDYEGEWLNYIVENPIGNFPYVTLSDVTEATVENVVPYAYKSAILNGNTKYRDIDTGEILETFEEGRNLELVSVKMPVLTTVGKNLFDGKYHAYKYVDTENGILRDSSDSHATDFILIRGFESISCSNEGYEAFAFYNENKIFIMGGFGKQLEVPKNAYYVRFTIKPTDNLAKFMVVEGSLLPPYEPYKTNILTVNEEVELRGIGEVQDTLDCLTGKVTERIGEIVIDGSEDENWIYQDATTSCNMYLKLQQEYDKNYDRILACDKLRIGALTSLNHDNVGIGLKTSVNGDEIIINVLKSSLDTQDEQGFKKWLSENPITFQYPLLKESIKTVDLRVIDQNGNTLTKIKPIEGTMHLSSSSDTIKPSFTGGVPVEAIMQNLSSFIEE